MTSFAVKPRPSIDFWSSNGELQTGDPQNRTILSSTATNGGLIRVEEFRFGQCEIPDLMFKQHVFAMNVGDPLSCEYKDGARFRRSVHATGAVCFVPSNRPFCVRLPLEEALLGNYLYVALDPAVVAETVTKLQLVSDRVELMIQWRKRDSVLHNIALAIQNGIRFGDASDRLYSEALSTALGVHLLREYGNVKLNPSESPSGLSRERLQLAFHYIQDRLSAELTVSGIAKVVGISVYHFIRLFRESTGKSPYQYVIDVRVRKAKELLATRKLTIAEVAYEVGFVDQSHLTRYFKRAFGITPSTFVSLSCRTFSFYGRNR